MIFRTREPALPLRPFVENFWYHEDLTVDHSMERLLPDGAIELIIDLTSSTKRWSDPASNEERVVRGGWVSGQHSRHIRIESAKASCMAGIRFRPGGAYPFFEFPISELNENVIEMELVWGPSFLTLRERLLAAKSVGERFALLESTLLRRGAARLQPEPFLKRALERLRHAPIKTLASELGVTQKCVVRTFADRVGLKPKTLARVLRFQTVVARLEAESRVSWSFIAQEAGYYDQAHFIREFEALSGLSPSRYLVEKGEYVNFVPLP